MLGVVIVFILLAELTYQNLDKIKKLKKEDEDDWNGDDKNIR